MAQYRVYYRSRPRYTDYEIHAYQCDCGMLNSNYDFDAPQEADSPEVIVVGIRRKDETASITIKPCCTQLEEG